ncbi:DUF983 domain-containing protein [Rhodovibrio salinarum]|uniref:DUF983 domain-containing protein n=1 Tax=Rhodovibrio salinarum TaxID=1087 RepID=A0A934QHN9_9PROT|nr:DUF983 domain-containing protein [Rhodovibrio salinarum]MBK1696720.1 DUF983 domain-containing protein [Rhodovibrio salinarum]
MSWDDSQPAISAYQAGLHCRCPRCGRGPLFKGLLEVRPECEVCGLDLSKADSGDGPAVFIIMILGTVVVMLALLLESLASPALWVHMAIWPAVIIAGSIWMLRPAKALLIALQFKNKAEDTGQLDRDDTDTSGSH